MPIEAPFDPAPRVHDEGLTGHRWWPLDELLSTREIVAPRQLGALLEALLRDGQPANAIEVA